MIGFTLEFKRWFIVLRGPKGKTYLAMGWAKHLPIITPQQTYSITEYQQLMKAQVESAALISDGNNVYRL